VTVYFVYMVTALNINLTLITAYTLCSKRVHPTIGRNLVKS